jgi:hypothetical protein
METRMNWFVSDAIIAAVAVAYSTAAAATYYAIWHTTLIDTLRDPATAVFAVVGSVAAMLIVSRICDSKYEHPAARHAATVGGWFWILYLATVLVLGLVVRLS